MFFGGNNSSYGILSNWGTPLQLTWNPSQTDLSKRSKVFPDGLLGRLSVQASDEDLLDRSRGHGHRPLGVD